MSRVGRFAAIGIIAGFHTKLTGGKAGSQDIENRQLSRGDLGKDAGHMINGLYTAGTAMHAATRQHEIIAQNLAHAQMPGYRRQTVRHSPVETNFDDELRNAAAQDAQGTDSEQLLTDFTPGPLERTDHPLDVAIQGDGFFVVEGPDGPLYTRNGAFQLDESGQLVTMDHLPVQGRGGAITIPPGTSATSIHIAADGTIYAQGAAVGQLDIVNFSEPEALQLTGVTLFSAGPEAGVMPAEAQVLQGMRERSNVSPIQEMVDLINVQRRQEAAQRSMSMLGDSVGKHISAQGGV